MLDVQEARSFQLTPLPVTSGDQRCGMALLSPSVVIAIPAYNEERFIGSIVLQSLQYAAHVIVVDDGSSDDTARIARCAGAEVLQHQVNMGKSAAVNTALAWARAQDVTALVLVDGDGQHKPCEIAGMISPILAGAADLVIGSRYLSIKSQIPGYRALGQRALTVITNLASSVAVSDSQSGFRSFSRRAIELMHFEGKGLSVESEMQFQVRAHRLVVKEVPISVVYAEKAKRNPFTHGLQVLTNIVKLVGQHRPLLFFGTQGLVLLVCALFTLLIGSSEYLHSGVLPLGALVISCLLLIMGLLACSIGLVLHSVRSGFVELRQVIQLTHRDAIGRTETPPRRDLSSAAANSGQVKVLARHS